MTIEPLDNRYEDYLRDESRIGGHGDWICFPENAEDVARAFAWAKERGLRVKLQGGRTGINGGALPFGGLVVSTARLNGISVNENGGLSVGAGVTLNDADAYIRRNCRDMRFTPNPTEGTATFGGMFATGAKGGNALRFGGVAEHTDGLVWVTPNGEIWQFMRGEFRFDALGCDLPLGGRLNCSVGLADGGIGRLCPHVDMDLVDFLAGSEGTLGAAVRLKLRLSPVPREHWCTLYFFDGDTEAMDFAAALSEGVTEVISEAEFFDEASINLLRRKRDNYPVLKSLPDLPGKAALMVTMEDDNALDEVLYAHMDAFESVGGREQNAWAAGSVLEAEPYRNLRHTLPEAINALVDERRLVFPACRKFTTDMTAPVDFRAYREMYRNDIAESGIEGYVFGHLLDNRLHVNLIPANAAEMSACEELTLHWARRTVNDGGVFIGENGVGHTKRGLVNALLSSERSEQLRGFYADFSLCQTSAGQ